MDVQRRVTDEDTSAAARVLQVAQAALTSPSDLSPVPSVTSGAACSPEYDTDARSPGADHHPGQGVLRQAQVQRRGLPYGFMPARSGGRRDAGGNSGGLNRDTTNSTTTLPASPGKPHFVISPPSSDSGASNGGAPGGGSPVSASGDGAADHFGSSVPSVDQPLPPEDVASAVTGEAEDGTGADGAGIGECSNIDDGRGDSPPGEDASSDGKSDGGVDVSSSVQSDAADTRDRQHGRVGAASVDPALAHLQRAPAKEAWLSHREPAPRRTEPELQEEAGFTDDVRCSPMLLSHAQAHPLTHIVQDVVRHGVYLGLDPQTDGDLLWIAEEAIAAPLPAGWHCDMTGAEHEYPHTMYYWNDTEPGTQWHHPLDQFYRAMIARMQAQKARYSLVAARRGETASHSDVSSRAGQRDERSQSRQDSHSLHEVASRKWEAMVLHDLDVRGDSDGSSDNASSSLANPDGVHRTPPIGGGGAPPRLPTSQAAADGSLTSLVWTAASSVIGGVWSMLTPRDATVAEDQGDSASDASSGSRSSSGDESDSGSDSEGHGDSDSAVGDSPADSDSPGDSDTGDIHGVGSPGSHPQGMLRRPQSSWMDEVPVAQPWPCQRIAAGASVTEQPVRGVYECCSCGCANHGVSGHHR